MRGSKKDERLTNQIMKEIADCAKRLSKEMKMAFVLINSGYGAADYAEDEIDITKEVVEVMNHEYQKSRK